jgi:hypothetical protein
VFTSCGSIVNAIASAIHELEKAREVRKLLVSEIGRSGGRHLGLQRGLQWDHLLLIAKSAHFVRDLVRRGVDRCLQAARGRIFTPSSWLVAY